MHPLRVACYWDGRPGHEKQSQAVISALEANTPLSVIPFKLRKTTGIRRLFQGIKSIFLPAHGWEYPLPENLDLIVGTGSSTHLPMVGLKLKTGAKLVTCMTPDPWLRSMFDLCLVPRHDRPKERRNYFATFGPPCLVMDAPSHDPQKGLILAGGIDPKSHHWDTVYFIGQVKNIIKKEPETVWTISSSPRTPLDTIEALARIGDRNDNVVFFQADDTPEGWIESAYAAHCRVWVTADSVSMIFEALTAGCRVGVLPVMWKSPDNKFQNGIDDLNKHGMVVDFDQWINGAQLPAASTPLNEAGRCAEEILRRWWPERLV